MADPRNSGLMVKPEETAAVAGLPMVSEPPPLNFTDHLPLEDLHGRPNESY